ncbi:FAD-dependent oxidoreductase [Solimonas soli]|uniref:FAD-dependent oxidoreductase n=1 Tax=Solimonas soli TaxID=413479 RepID=UPI0004B79D4E|nr:FAD-dependent oxidoreductase [Solimonas soli]
MKFDHQYDFVIVGSGAASMCAALVVQQQGKRALVVEKTDQVGGSTAMSGGVVWIPDNPAMKRAGVADSYEKAREYLDACVGDVGPASSPQRRHAFLSQGPRAIEFLERLGMEFVHAEGYSDYHEGTRPGGIARSRSLVGRIYDARRLGAWRSRLRRYPGIPPMEMHESGPLGLNGRTWESARTFARVALRLLRNKLGADLVGTGAALQGRLLEIALRHEVPIWLDAPVQRLITDDDRVVGVELHKDGKTLRVGAADGVLLNVGGFSHNRQMREQYQQQPTGTDWTHANPGDTGELLQAAIGLGADVALMEQSWWVSTSVTPDGQRLIHPFDMSKPYCILVDSGGSRYVNESTSYMEVGIRMYARDRIVPAVPSWLIMDSRHRKRYRWGGLPGGEPPRAWLDSGYMIRADSLDALAESCAIPAATLRATVARFNDFARSGVDADFQRGMSAYDRWQGDPAAGPNPNLGSIEKPPFYACRLYPGDVGTCGGMLTDEYARVLRQNGSTIAGLYATGNCTASVLGRAYPGAGASIGASLTFGYIAARHAIDASTPASAGPHVSKSIHESCHAS